MKKVLFLITTGSIFLAGCGVLSLRNTIPAIPIEGSWWEIITPLTVRGSISLPQNDRGNRISYTCGPAFGGGMMRGSSVTCASCHGADGRGGVHMMPMQVMDAPDIRYAALTSEGDDHGGNEQGEDSHEDEHSEYGLNEFRLAVVNGQHPDGEPLSRDMPRWQMSDRDLADVFDFIKTLP